MGLGTTVIKGIRDVGEAQCGKPPRPALCDLPWKSRAKDSGNFGA